MLLIESCKKDPAVQALSVNNIVSPSSAKTNYNITYKLWSPFAKISSTTTKDSALLINLDSNNIHNIVLSVSEYYAGVFGGGIPSPEYGSDAMVLRSGNDTTVFLASIKPASIFTAILANDWINDNLNWVTSLDLKSMAWGGGGASALGDWDLCLVNSAYVGIKIKTTYGNKYGWLKLDVPNSESMTIEAQALNNNYGQYIQAGQTY